MRQLVPSTEARPAKRQHRAPCSDCPWARKALPGWLGPLQAPQWVQVAHGEGEPGCHTRQGMACAGIAIYRANVCKAPRDPEAFRLPANKTSVFATPAEFLAHHERK